MTWCDFFRSLCSLSCETQSFMHAYILDKRLPVNPRTDSPDDFMVMSESISPLESVPRRYQNRASMAK